MQKLRFQIASTGDFYPRPDHNKYQDIFGIFTSFQENWKMWR